MLLVKMNEMCCAGCYWCLYQIKTLLRSGIMAGE